MNIITSCGEKNPFQHRNKTYVSGFYWFQLVSISIAQQLPPARRTITMKWLANTDIGWPVAIEYLKYLLTVSSGTPKMPWIQLYYPQNALMLVFGAIEMLLWPHWRCSLQASIYRNWPKWKIKVVYKNVHRSPSIARQLETAWFIDFEDQSWIRQVHEIRLGWIVVIFSVATMAHPRYLSSYWKNIVGNVMVAFVARNSNQIKCMHSILGPNDVLSHP